LEKTGKTRIKNKITRERINIKMDRSSFLKDFDFWIASARRKTTGTGEVEYGTGEICYKFVAGSFYL
jgi:hypothetical protein